MKRKVNLNRANVSADEINQRKNFDSVLKNNAAINTKPLFKKPWFLSAIAAAVLISTAVILLNKTAGDKEQANIQQADNAAADSSLLAAFYKTEEARPCISPPIMNLNVPYTSFKVKAEEGAAFDFKSGSEITVPKNAFVNENGKTVKGEVELRYREFHDAADFFVSGIPMTYDSAGIRYHFESAGMIEMLAYQDGKEVKMAPGKSINVELATSYKGSEYNLYKLDTLRNNWSCLGKDKAIVKKTSVKDVVSSQPSREETPEYKAVETKKAEAIAVKETQTAALPKITAGPKKPVKADKEKFTFNLEVDPKEYPELVVYKGVLFEVGDENKNFSRSMYSVTWDAAAIKEGSKKGENYLLLLEKGTKKYELVVYPVLDGKNFELAQKDFQDKFLIYNAALAKRKTNEKRIEDEYQAKITALLAEQKAIELKWKRDVDSRLAAMTAQEKVMRVFSISSFGVFNSDNPCLYPKGVMCNALLVNEQNKHLKCYDVFLVDKHRNGLFTYSKNPIASFSFDPNASNILWTAENGVLYYLNPEGFKGLSNGAQTIKMNKVDEQFKSVDEMKAFFNL
jgi:hypothetical protein